MRFSIVLFNILWGCTIISNLLAADFDWSNQEKVNNSVEGFVDSIKNSAPNHVCNLLEISSGEEGIPEDRKYRVWFQGLNSDCWKHLQQAMPSLPFEIFDGGTVTTITFNFIESLRENISATIIFDLK